MPVVVDWYDDEQQNICYTITGEWTWDELLIAIDEVLVLLDSIDYPVNLILS